MSMTFDDRNYEEIKQHLLTAVNHAAITRYEQAKIVNIVHKLEKDCETPRIVCLEVAQYIVKLLK